MGWFSGNGIANSARLVPSSSEKLYLKSYGQSFIECIQTEEYMHVYNAIIVLKEILPIFPSAAVADVGPSINAAVDSLLEKEARGDLKILGKAYVLV